MRDEEKVGVIEGILVLNLSSDLTNVSSLSGEILFVFLPLLQAKFQNHKQDIASVFEQGYRFLREREQHLLEWLEGMEQPFTEGRNSHVTKGSEEVIRLETLISELEQKARQPALELWQVMDQLNCTQVLLLQAAVWPLHQREIWTRSQERQGFVLLC